MSIIERISGRAVPVRGNDIDTDRIIPARFLRCVTFDGLGAHAFADDRVQDRAAGRVHPFDDPRFAGAAILIANSNFGCGSSREHAPQSLCKWGIQAIVAVSFAEIFYNNNIALGVPCLQVTASEAVALQDAVTADPQLAVTVDVAACQVRCGDLVVAAEIPEGVRSRFLEGSWDATGQLLADPAAIEAVLARLPYCAGFPGTD